MLESTVGIIDIDESKEASIENERDRLLSRLSVDGGSSTSTWEENSGLTAPHYDESWSSEVYHDKPRPSYSYPWAEIDYVPDDESLNALIMASLVVACSFLSVLVIFVSYKLWRMYKVHRLTASESSIRSQLNRFEDSDICLCKTLPGGWNVTYRRRLANKVQYYWTRELPSSDDVSTMVFSKDSKLTCDHTVLSHNLFPHSCDASSCASLVTTGKPPKRSRILFFLRTQFPLEDVLLTECFTTGGFSATYCHGSPEEDIDDTIEFYPIASDRMPHCSSSLFPKILDDENDHVADVENVWT